MRFYQAIIVLCAALTALPRKARTAGVKSWSYLILGLSLDDEERG